MKILVTGCCGFIGFHLTSALLKNKKFKVFGIDNINSYYDLTLKENRLKKLKLQKKFSFIKIDLKNKTRVNRVFKDNKFNTIIHLAAQAGVRHSVGYPRSYLENNIDAYFNVLDASRKFNIKHFLFASTSSVYGKSTKYPLKEDYDTSKPLSFYAATKKANEVMAYSYANIYKLPCTALRFFTVYGELGRPDMAIYEFADKIRKNNIVKLFNKGNHFRDFTYIDDVVNYIIKLLDKKSKDEIPFQVFNIGNGKTRSLKKFISIIEDFFQKKAKFKLLPMQKGDTLKTHASINKIVNLTKYKPKFSIENGIKNYLKWFQNYYK